MNRILIIRGGAIGDFILTLPALKALRDAYPDARIEILGYEHIAALARNRFYADAARSIEYAALSGFFAKGGTLDPVLSDYFASFDLVISYLFDPDGIFQANLQRSGVKKMVCGAAQIAAGSHAADQLAQPIKELGIRFNHCAARIFPSEEDRQYARDFLAGLASPIFALHAGSGSARKNWPLDHWIRLGDHLLGQNAGASVLIVSGEADEIQRTTLENRWRDRGGRFATNIQLPYLAAILAGCVFIGHDSGISHLAAAAGAKCLLLFGPTDPAVWAPQGENVRILHAPDNDLSQLTPEAVFEKIGEEKW
ncbi:MAG TPA: glycosyltransferase family 9 protein [Chthoniobacterales bacterium]|jgi:heptosyltransferase-2